MAEDKNQDRNHEGHDGCGCASCDCGHYEETDRQKFIFKIAAGGFFLFVGFVLSELCEAGRLKLPEFTYLLCFMISYIVVGFDILRDAINGVIHGNVFNENLLMGVASIGAFAIDEYSEGCMVVFLFTVGEFLQGLAVDRSRRKIKDAIGSDEILKNGQAEAEVMGDYNAFSEPKAHAQKFITRFAKIYTPAVCLLAVLIMLVPPLFFGGDFREWIYRGLSALVVSCPCALVISIPLGFFAGVGACGKSGVLVKSSGILETLAKADAAFLEKTDAPVENIGIKETIIFTNSGEEESTDKEFSRLSVDEKLDYIKNMQNDGKTVAFAGNDAADVPLISQSDVGISLETADKNAARAADIIILGSSFSPVASGKKIASKTLRIVRENIVFSIAVKLIIIIGCAVGIFDENAMWLAVFGDVGVCFIAIANSLRAMYNGRVRF